MSVKSKTALGTDIDTKLASGVPIVASVHRSLEHDIVDSYEDFVGSYTTAQIAALGSMTLRQIVYDTDLNAYYYYTGTTWKPLSPRTSTQLIGVKLGLNLNTTSAQAINLTGGSSFIITDVIMCNASTNIDTAAGGRINEVIDDSGIGIMYTAAGIEMLSLLVNSSNFINHYLAQFANGDVIKGLIVSSFGGSTDRVITTNTVYFFLTTPQGAVATADIYIFGFVL